MWRRCGWVVVLALASCFGDPPTATGGTGDGDPMCSLGARLCPCDAGACEPGLICAPSVDRCVSPDCDVGERDCPCGDAMQCEGDLVCVDDLCNDPQMMDPSGTSSDPTATPTTTPETSSSPSETGMTSVDTTASSQPMTSGETSSTSAADTGSLCADATCTECYSCAMADDGPCAVEANACEMMMMATPPCFSIIYGWQMCEASMSCECPDPADADGTALVECLLNACDGLDCHCF